MYKHRRAYDLAEAKLAYAIHSSRSIICIQDEGECTGGRLCCSFLECVQFYGDMKEKVQRYAAPLVLTGRI
jgi:hypothetical protein